MSILTPLLAAYGARGKAKNEQRQQQYENSLEAQRLKSETDYNTAELGIQRSQADRDKAKEDAAMRASGIDPATGQYAPLTIPKALQQVIPGNKGKAPDSSSPQYWAALAAHETALAQQYRAAGRSVEADSHSQNARDASLNASSLANSTFTAGAKTDLTGAQIGLTDARAAAERDLPARAREIARGHDDASIQRAGMQAQAAWSRAQLSATTRQQVAQYQGTTRFAVAQLAGAYMLAGHNAEDATRMAISDFQQKEMNYRQSIRPVSGTDVLPPGYDTAAPPAPITQNFYGQNGGAPGGFGGAPPFPGAGGGVPVTGPNTVQLPPPSWNPQAQTPNAARLPASAKRAPAPGQTNAGGPQDPKVRQWVGYAKEALQQMRPHDVRAALDAQVRSGAITDAERKEIIKEAQLEPLTGGGGFGPEPAKRTSLAPPPVGGSAAAGNPTLA